jgi:threonine synthase
VCSSDLLCFDIRVCAVCDEDIEAQIRFFHATFGIAICPHTATASYAYQQLAKNEQGGTDWVIVATAHPAKFEQIVEPLIEQQIPLPEPLLRIQSKPSLFVAIDADMQSLKQALHDRFHLDAGEKPGDK